MEDWLEVAHLYALAPLPCWTHVHESDDVVDLDGDRQLDAQAVEAVVGAGQRLLPFGFALDGPPRLIDNDHLVLTFVRGVDAITIAVMQRTCFIGFQSGVDESLDEYDTRRLGTFGAFPVAASGSAQFEPSVERVVGWFVSAGGALLAVEPLPIVELATRCDEAAALKRTEVLTRFHRRRADEAWSARRHRAAVDHYENLAQLTSLEPSEQDRLEQARARLASEERPAPPGHSRTVTLADLVEAVNSSHAALRAGYAARGQPNGMARWEDAAIAHWHAVGAFEDHVARIEHGLRSDEPEAVDAAIEFLEADPWCFRSGYAKGRLLRRLRSRPLSQAQTRRLGAVVLHVIDVGVRLEFRDVTRLARRLDGPTLRGELRRRLRGLDTGVARRALLALFDLRRPRLTPADVERAHRLVLDELRRRETSPDDWSLPRWPERIGARLASAEWTQDLNRPGSDGGSGYWVPTLLAGSVCRAA